MRLLKKLMRNPKLFFRDAQKKRIRRREERKAIREAQSSGTKEALIVLGGPAWLESWTRDNHKEHNAFVFVPQPENLSGQTMKAMEKLQTATVWRWETTKPNPVDALAEARDWTVLHVNLARFSPKGRPASLTFETLPVSKREDQQSDLEHHLFLMGQHSNMTEDQKRQAQILMGGLSDTETEDDSEILTDRAARTESQTVLVIGHPGGDDDDSERPKSSRELLLKVLQDKPNATVLFLPDPVKDAHLKTKSNALNWWERRCLVLHPDTKPTSCLRHVDEIHVTTSDLGFVALMMGKKVVTHGHPFYAGWGLTQDTLPLPARKSRIPLTLEQLICGTCFSFPKHDTAFDPNDDVNTTKPKTIEETNLLAPETKNKTDQKRCPRVFATNSQIETHPVVKAHTQSTHLIGRKTKTHRQIQLETEDLIAGWGGKVSAQRARELAETLGLKHLNLEDAFLRGVHRSEPALALLWDTVGCYHQAEKPSAVEIAIKAGTPDIERARHLHTMWIEHGVSKHNDLRDPETLPNKPYVLVVDQVRGDSSIPGAMANAESFEKMLRTALAEQAILAI